MEQILLTYGILKETITAIMMLYKNTKVKVHSPDRDTDYFDIVAGFLQEDSLAPYLFIISLDYVLRMSINLMNNNNADDLVLLANTAAAGIGLHVNAGKTEYMCSNQRGVISTLNCSSLKLVDKFTYLGSSVSSPKKDVNIQLAKA